MENLGLIVFVSVWVIFSFLAYWITECKKKVVMRDIIKKWWNRTWSNWEVDSKSEWDWYIVLRRTSNDGLIQFKKVYKK